METYFKGFWSILREMNCRFISFGYGLGGVL